MSQGIEKITELLKRLEQEIFSGIEDFEILLSDICTKAEFDTGKSVTTLELLREYVEVLSKTELEKYSITLSKFRNIEEPLKLIVRNCFEQIQAQEILTSYSSALNKFVSEDNIRAEIKSVKQKISKLVNVSPDERVKMLNSIKPILGGINKTYKDAVCDMTKVLRSFLGDIEKNETFINSGKYASRLDIVFQDLQIIENYILFIKERNGLLGKLLTEVITNESLKISDGVMDSVYDKIQAIATDLSSMKESNAPSEVSIKAIEHINSEIERIHAQITDVKDKIAVVNQNTAQIKSLEKSIQNLYYRSTDLAKNIEGVPVELPEGSGVWQRMESLTSDIDTLKNIIADLKEVTYSKVVSTVNDISFENESYDIKNHVSKMLTQLPQKEDIEQILSDGRYATKSLDEINEQTKLINEKVDFLATKEDIEKGEKIISKKILEVADKQDIENLSLESKEIKQMISNIDLEDELKNLYDKENDIEDWLLQSNLKENTRNILKILDDKAEQTDVMRVLDVTNKIVDKLQDMSEHPDSNVVKQVLADAYKKVEALKVEFLNTTEFHDETILEKLAQLQASIESATTGEDFGNFVNELKSITHKLIKDNEDFTQELLVTKKIQEEIINKIDNLKFSEVVNQLNNDFESFAGDIQRSVEASNTEFYQKMIDVENRLTSLSEFLEKSNVTSSEEIIKTIQDLKSEVKAKEGDFAEIQGVKEGQIEEIKNYLNWIKNLLSDTELGINEEIQNKMSSVESELEKYNTDIGNKLEALSSNLDNCMNIISNSANAQEMRNSLQEISEIKKQLQTLSLSFETINVDNNPNGKGITNFVSSKLAQLGDDIEDLAYEIKDGFQQGFAYNAELLEEKNEMLLDFIKELRHANTDNIELYERLTVTDNKLMDIKQELELVNTDVIGNLNNKTEMLLNELNPIKAIISEFSNRLMEEQKNLKLKERLENLHEEISNELMKTTEFSKATFKKSDELYQEILADLSGVEKRIKEFILRDSDSLIAKIDILKNAIDSLNNMMTPIAQQMSEFQEFAQEIRGFRDSQKQYITTTVDELKNNIKNDFKEELKNTIEDVQQNINQKSDDMHKDIAGFADNLDSKINSINSNFDNNINDLVNNINNSIGAINSNIDKNIASFSSSVENSIEALSNNFSKELEEISEDVNDKVESINMGFTSNITDIKDDFDDKFSEMSSSISGSIGVISNDINNQHEEIKSMLTVAINNDAILQEIDNVKDSFKSQLNELIEFQNKSDLVKNSQYGSILGNINAKTEKVINNLKENFDEFSQSISKLTNDNADILNVLKGISDKIGTITVRKQSEISDDIFDELDDKFSMSDDHSKEDSNIVVAENDFDFMTAFDLLKQDIANLRVELENVVSPIADLIPENKINSIGELSIKNRELIALVNNKIDTISTLLRKNWLEEIKDYIASSDIHYMLEQINKKIDGITLAENNQILDEIKVAIKENDRSDIDENNREMLESINDKVEILISEGHLEHLDEIKNIIEKINSDRLDIDCKNSEEVKELLSIITQKIDRLLDSTSPLNNIDDIQNSLVDVTDQVRNITDNLEGVNSKVEYLQPVPEKFEMLSKSDEKITALLEVLLEKIDTISDTNNDNATIEKINDLSKSDEKITSLLENLNQKVDTITDNGDIDTLDTIDTIVSEKVENLSQSDAKITSMLEVLNHKIDIISYSDEAQQEIEDIKGLILDQKDYIDRLGEDNDSTMVFKRCLDELIIEVNNLNTSSDADKKEVQKTLKEMKESIMSAVVSIFQQVSFMEESEDIKDFVEEKTDVINKNLVEVTRQLKQIAKSNDDEDYIYSMQDIESDLAKLRLALSDIQSNEELTKISETLNKMITSVEFLKDPMTQDEIRDLRFNISNLQEELRKASVVSGESYTAINNGFEGFGKIITTQVSNKIDYALKMLEKNAENDQVMRQALVYMGEWIDSASDSMDKISTYSDSIKDDIILLKDEIPQKREYIQSIEDKFEDQRDKLKSLERIMTKLGDLGERMEKRIDRMESSIDRVLNAVEIIENSDLTGRINRLEKQMSKLGLSVEKIASYVD